MSKLGEGMIEELIDRIPSGNLIYEYVDKYGTYNIYFKKQDDYAFIEDLSEEEVILILSALCEMCEKAGNK